MQSKLRIEQHCEAVLVSIQELCRRVSCIVSPNKSYPGPADPRFQMQQKIDATYMINDTLLLFPLAALRDKIITTF